MKLHFISYHKSKELENSLKRIYDQAFPDEEKTPLFLMKLRARQGKAGYYGIYDKKNLVGLLYNIYYKDLIYVLFFAIDENLRGCGYGGRVLKILQSKYQNKRIFLCIESMDPKADNYEQRLKRKAFYERNGFEMLTFTLREGLVTYDTMAVATRNPKVTKKECQELMLHFFGIFGINIYIKQLFYKIEDALKKGVIR